MVTKGGYEYGLSQDNGLVMEGHFAAEMVCFGVWDDSRSLPVGVHQGVHLDICSGGNTSYGSACYQVFWE